mmetsp:Transcript_27294/g.56910  ORF Transcript_27294/g.56910 Transcript_27294/m.56910 type:complete len:161 (+) Transcript_27294:2-484(+)
MNIKNMQERQESQRCQTPPLQELKIQLSPPPAPIAGSKRINAERLIGKFPSFSDYNYISLCCSQSIISDNPNSYPSPSFRQFAMNPVENYHSPNLQRLPTNISPISKNFKRRPILNNGRRSDRAKAKDMQHLYKRLPRPPFVRSQTLIRGQKLSTSDLSK